MINTVNDMLDGWTPGVTLHRLGQVIQGETGWQELLVGVAALLCAWLWARQLYRRYFQTAQAQEWPFGKYLLYRLVYPLSAQLLTQALALGWQLLQGQSSVILMLSATLLFWLSLIRVLTAIVRHALPEGKVERHSEHLLAMLLWLAFAAWVTGIDTLALSWLESVRFRVGKNELNLLMILSALLGRERFTPAKVGGSLLTFAGVAIALAGTAVSGLIGTSKPEAVKLSEYESGFPAFSDARTKFDVQFYLVAILFIVFDLEAAFLFPWAVSFLDLGWAAWITMMVFIAELVVGLVYAWKMGALDWE